MTLHDMALLKEGPAADQLLEEAGAKYHQAHLLLPSDCFTLRCWYAVRARMYSKPEPVFTLATGVTLCTIA
jgi:hypothetical protein